MHIFFLLPTNSFHIFLAIKLGFTSISYTVDEGIGSLQVDVRVFSPPDDQPLPTSVFLVIETMSGSASKLSAWISCISNFLMLYIVSWRK